MGCFSIMYIEKQTTNFLISSTQCMVEINPPTALKSGSVQDEKLIKWPNVATPVIKAD